ncbi:CaiB/BaiF CoA transferase family protein [Kutzneria sp. NPDC052558]|uniref:CaiB/BaiF CoA transferase family protein n=1 Tax=Kutzneria sp. NPDC052558 TaxID=3364121 RepID=UPI0037CAE884
MGPLAGVRVVELAGFGPGPHAAMMLGDWGADVVRIVRKAADGTPQDLVGDAQLRNRTVVAADLKSPDDVAETLDLLRFADVLIEGFRPGTVEKLGLGPRTVTTVNPQLIYARITGWGQDGPRAATAGHDINYVSVTGVLAAIGEPDRPSVPLNLIGDLSGGSLFLLAGILAALHERTRSGLGQVLDVAMVDGISTLAQQIWSLRAMGVWEPQRSANLIDGGAPFYGVYECADGEFVAVGALEHKFYEILVAGLGLDAAALPDRDDRRRWPELRQIFAQTFKAEPRDTWCARFAGADACLTPVLSMDDALEEQQLRHRRLFADPPHTMPAHTMPAQTMPAQMFGRSRCAQPTPPGSRTAALAEVIRQWTGDTDS